MTARRARRGAGPAVALVAALVLGLGVSESSAQAAPTVHRFALIAGNNHGGPRTRPLLYAEDDATRMAQIFERLGGVSKGDVDLLLDGSAQDFLGALGELEKRAQAAKAFGETTVLYVYYSGHSVEGALALGDSELPLESLKARLAQAPADVRIGIFDACRSGLLTRAKGVRRAPAFAIDAQPTTSDAHGTVILTSSAADEDSQESDEIGGSYFSHHLASGLLGDADRSGDGEVTLAEAYAYAYDRTVADTAESAAGAQHPTFSFDLAGNGDWVLTELPRNEGIRFPASLAAGTYYLVRDGRVAAEVAKAEGIARQIALVPGTYTVKRRLSNRLRMGEVSVAAGQMVDFSSVRLHDAPFSDDPVKGLSVARGGVRLNLVATVQTFVGAYARGLFPTSPLFGAQLELPDFFRPNWSWALDLSVGGSQGAISVDSFGLPYTFSELTAGSAIRVHFPTGAWSPFLGARLEYLAMHRTFSDGTAASAGTPAQSYASFSPGVVGGLDLKLSRAWSLTAQARTHYLLYNVDDNRSLFFFELGLTVGYAL
jgi:hypothetical protein